MANKRALTDSEIYEIDRDYEPFIKRTELLLIDIYPLNFNLDVIRQIVRVIGSNITVEISVFLLNDIVHVMSIKCPLCSGTLYAIVDVETDDLVILKCARCKKRFSALGQAPYILDLS